MPENLKAVNGCQEVLNVGKHNTVWSIIMGKVNPVREFLRRVKALCDAENELTSSKWDADKRKYHQRGPDGRNYWPFGISRECAPEDCFKREDGLWEQKKMINTHMKHGGEVCAFIWRLHPNYSCHGQPCITNKNQKEFYEKSETEKVLFETDTLSFVWLWSEVIPPNRNKWGSSMGPTYFEVRDKKTGFVHIQTPYKAELIREYNAMFPRG